MNLPINRIICGDCLEVMKDWPDGCIDCCVTSPPYWGLRDYGVDGQLGLEKTPEEYVAKMVEIFQEVKRVLKDEGTLWLNLGDSYCGSPPGTRGKHAKGEVGDGVYKRYWDRQLSHGEDKKSIYRTPPGLKHKDLCGIPWRVAFTLQADGWYLRQDIIWHKPNPMPESVRDRCTKAHEYIFLLTKKPRYYYDAEAIKVPLAESTANDKRTLNENYTQNRPERGFVGNASQGAGMLKSNGGTRNKRSVWRLRRSQWRQYCNRLWEQFERRTDIWTVTTKPYSEAHFATFPPDLITPCILAGCPKQVCKKCGKARDRVVDKPVPPEEVMTNNRKPNDKLVKITANKYGKGQGQKLQNWLNEHPSQTTGWTDCGCGEGFEPGIVLDPFMGSGTVAEVAVKNGRDYVGCELKPEYIKLGRVEAVETGVPVKEQRKGQMALFDKDDVI